MNTEEMYDKYAFRMYKKYLLETLKKYGYTNIDVYENMFGVPSICGEVEGYSDIDEFTASKEYNKIYDEAEEKAMKKIKEYEIKHKIDRTKEKEETEAFIKMLDSLHF